MCRLLCTHTNQVLAAIHTHKQCYSFYSGRLRISMTGVPTPKVGVTGTLLVSFISLSFFVFVYGFFCVFVFCFCSCLFFVFGISKSNVSRIKKSFLVVNNLKEVQNITSQLLREYENLNFSFLS